MIETILLSSSFMIIIFIGIMVIVVQIKRFVEKKEIEMEKRTEELKQEVADLSKLFQSEIADVIGKVKNLLN